MPSFLEKYSAAGSNEDKVKARNPKQTPASKLVKSIQQQINLVKGMIDSKPYTEEKKKNNKTIQYTPTPWFWAVPDSKEYKTHIKKGSVKLVLYKFTTFTVPSLKALITFYEDAITATEAGEFDKALAKIAASRGSTAA